MSKKKTNYRKLPGSYIDQLSWNIKLLWLGADHLLIAEQVSFSEVYKRFYYRDIQAFIIHPTVLRLNVNVAMASLMGFCGLLYLAGDIWRALGIVFGTVCLITFIINSLRGPTCVCYLRTAVNVEKLPSLRRMQNARKAREALRAEIANVQGLLDHKLVAMKEQERRTTEASTTSM